MKRSLVQTPAEPNWDPLEIPGAIGDEQTWHEFWTSPTRPGGP